MKRAGARTVPACLPALVTVLLVALTSCGGPATPSRPHVVASATVGATAVGRPLALVYKGPAACDGCPEAAGAMLQRDGFEVRYIGPDQAVRFSAAALAKAALYVQPGAANGQSLTDGWRRLNLDPAFRPTLIRDYIRNGGHYLGVCMGGYLAGDPGFDVLPGNTDEFIKSPGASVTTEDDQLVTVDWRGHQRQLYFQDGPYFDIDGDGVEVLARYTNGLIAAAVAPYGSGRVGVLGPHPEAPSEWYQDYDLPDRSAASQAPWDDMLHTLMGTPQGPGQLHFVT
jgi:hypothetical protein